ncbi:MAG: DNA/RNA non-specific endonuclease [Cyanobacteria bacterium P01_A01_bin.40]
MKLQLIIFKLCSFTVLGLVLLLFGCSTSITQNVHLKYGNPSGAGDLLNNYLMEKPEYALSYNCQAGIANWVSWQLDRSWLGRTERSDDFRPDANLPADCYAVRPQDYRGSGYDRGHLVPSGDRTQSRLDNSSTFVMTNMMPQSPSNNREVWRELEEYSRDLVAQGKELYVVAGGNGIAEKIAQSKVVVPEYTWKVILILDRPSEELTIDNTETLAVWIPNTEEVLNTDWQDYIVSVDEVEKKTGYNFFAVVPQKLQRQLEPAYYGLSPR